LANGSAGKARVFPWDEAGADVAHSADSQNPVSFSFEATLVDNDVTEDGCFRVAVASYDMLTGKYLFAWFNPVFADVS